MEDKRIRKTKKYLKNTLIELLNEKPFEEITVTNICETSDISRITFYSHYKDKYDLVEDIFQDMIKIGTDEYRRLESSLNINDELAQGFADVLDSIFFLFFGNYDFFKHVNPDDNPYLAYTFYNHIMRTIEHHTNKEGGKHKMNFSVSQITGFICYGILGFLNEGKVDINNSETVKNDVKRLMRGLLESKVLFD